MQIRDAHSTSQSSPPGCLMAMLGLDLSTIESGDTEIFRGNQTTLRELQFPRSLRIDP